MSDGTFLGTCLFLICRANESLKNTSLQLTEAVLYRNWTYYFIPTAICMLCLNPNTMPIHLADLHFLLDCEYYTYVRVSLYPAIKWFDGNFIVFLVMHVAVQLEAAHPSLMEKSVSGIESCSGSLWLGVLTTTTTIVIEVPGVGFVKKFVGAICTGCMEEGKRFLCLPLWRKDISIWGGILWSLLLYIFSCLHHMYGWSSFFFCSQLMCTVILIPFFSCPHWLCSTWVFGLRMLCITLLWAKAHSLPMYIYQSMHGKFSVYCVGFSSWCSFYQSLLLYLYLLLALVNAS